ncbi:hypothetical protein ABV409_07255 [Flagellimonas sp. DF-77]|uniref:hypothetical protein n=1 Tax=Flagellimonas algarum TaxID=3230298 RepID=UPI0033997666
MVEHTWGKPPIDYLPTEIWLKRLALKKDNELPDPFEFTFSEFDGFLRVVRLVIKPNQKKARFQ